MVRAAPQIWMKSLPLTEHVGHRPDQLRPGRGVRLAAAHQAALELELRQCPLRRRPEVAVDDHAVAVQGQPFLDPPHGAAVVAARDDRVQLDLGPDPVVQFVGRLRIHRAHMQLPNCRRSVSEELRPARRLGSAAEG